jgi:ParB family transcriptional regulator, chromosome partitioning protein
MNPNIEIDNNVLQAQIESISNYDRELTPGKATKAVMASVDAKSSDLYKVDPKHIFVVEGYNPRVQNRPYFEGIEALAENMVKHGYMADKPLAVYSSVIDGVDRLVLQDGHRRYAAALRAIELGAPIKMLPVVLKDRSDNQVDLTLALLHSNEGAPFNTYEKAILAKRLKKAGWENKQIAEEMRCTPAFVGQLLTMAGAPTAIHDLVKQGRMSVTEAIDIVREHKEGAADVALQQVARSKYAGKAKATAKDDPEKRKASKAKNLGVEACAIIDRLFKIKAVVDLIPNTIYERMDAVMTALEKASKPKEPKQPKAPKAAKAPKAPKAPKEPKQPKPAAKKKAPAKAATANKKQPPWAQVAA